MTQEDIELKVMSWCYSLLSDLKDDKEALSRVLHWLSKKLEITNVINTTDMNQKNQPHSHSQLNREELWSFETLADIFAEISPTTENDKVLVASAYLQNRDQLTEFTSAIVQTELTHLWHGISNITRTFDNLLAQKPAVVIQTRKEWKSKQARKKYKVTVEWMKLVKSRLTK